MEYEIWQLPVSHKNCFKGSIWNIKPIKMLDYVHVYCGNIDSDDLDDIYELLNVNHPADYYARSLSVSDIICCIKEPNKREWYYVDDFGFTKLDEKEIIN